MIIVGGVGRNVYEAIPSRCRSQLKSVECHLNRRNAYAPSVKKKSSTKTANTKVKMLSFVKATVKNGYTEYALAFQKKSSWKFIKKITYPSTAHTAHTSAKKKK